MDKKDLELNDNQFSLESILEEFGIKSASEPVEESAELPGEISKELEMQDDNADVGIVTGGIEDVPPEKESEFELNIAFSDKATAEMDEVDRIIAEIRGDTGYNPKPPAEDPVIPPEESEPSDEKPIPAKRKGHSNIFSGKVITEDDAPVIEPDKDDAHEDIHDSGEYAEGSTDYSQHTEDVISDRELVEPEPKKSRSFKQLLGGTALSALAMIGVKIGQSRSFFVAAPPEEEDDLGEELSPAKAAKFYQKRLPGLRTRTKAALIITAVLMYISLGLPVFGALNSLAVSGAVCLILLLTVMILGLDVISSGLTVMGKKRLNANSLVALSCIFSVIDGFIIACGVKSPGIPFCAVSALTLSLTMLGSVLNCRANNVVFRIAASSKRMYTLSAESDVSEGSITMLKSPRGTKGFVRRAEEAGPDELVFAAMAPIVIPTALVLSIIAAAVSKSWGSFAHIVSGIFVFAAPAAIMFSYALPFFISAMGLARHGACIAGWSGLYDMGKSRDIIITDRDLFSPEDVSISELRILGGADPTVIISMAASIITASGCAMSHAFDELLEKGNGKLLEVDEFKCHESGGLVALINGKEVICGSGGFMQLMNVRLADKVLNNNCVYLAVNRVLMGIFKMNYTAGKDAKSSLQKLLASNREPTFAIRDFNLTPTMLSRKFDTPTDGFNFPPFPQRYAISSAIPSENSKPAAVLSKEGLEPYVDLSDHGRRLYNLVKISNFISAASSVLGMILMFIFFCGASYGMASTSTALIYMLVCLLPELIMSFTFKAE